MKKKKLNKGLIFIFLTLLITVLWTSKAFFHPGFYTNHDGRHQLIRLYQFHKNLHQGQFPVRWAGDLKNGFGYPVLNFTYQLPWYVGEVFLNLGFSLANTVKALFVLASFLSAYFMFLWQRQLWQNKWAGLLVSLIWIWLPYHFLINLVRAALGEAFVLAFMPLFFYSLTKICQKKSWGDIYLLALSWAAMVLSHAVVAFFYLPVGLLYVLFLIDWKKRKSWLASLKKIFLGLGLGFGLAAFYFFPAIAEKKLLINPGFDNYKTHLVHLKQLIYSPWGYGFSMPDPQPDGMSFQIGIVQWLLVGLSLPLVTYSLFKRSVKTEYLKVANLFIIAFAVCIFLLTPISDPVWARIVHIVLVYFPWRLISVAALSASSLAGFVYIWLVKNFKSKLILIGFFSFILSVAVYTNRNHIKVNQYVNLQDEEIWQDQSTANSFDEYLPKWADGDYFSQTQVENVNFIINKSYPHSRGRVISFHQPRSTEFNTEIEVLSDQAMVRLNRLYYPGWQVFVNGQPVEIEYLGQQGAIGVALPKGKYQIRAVFKETPFRLMANYLSLIAWLVLAVGVIKLNLNHD